MGPRIDMDETRMETPEDEVLTPRARRRAILEELTESPIPSLAWGTECRTLVRERGEIATQTDDLEPRL
jgi:hypothetical protein